METILKINEAYRRHLSQIRQLSLTGWVKLATDLGVATNDREHAAKKLAIREVLK